MRILIIDNSIDPDSWGSAELCAMARLATGATIHVRRAPHGDLPSNALDYDRILISGSKTSVEEEAPWIDALDELIRRVVDAGKPVLGVCYGHQSLNRALGGRKLTRKASRGEFGWGEIERVDLDSGRGSPLLEGLPRKFHTFQWHNDEVSSLAPGMRLLARSEICPVQACELKGKPVFGVQFHPERGVERGERSLARRKAEMPKAERLNPGRGIELYDAAASEKIFRNFLSLESA
jgi:GMP synthase-like glutamine amidotransferase